FPPRPDPKITPAGVCGISRSFPRLSPTTGQVPTRYSPVRHSPETEAPEAFDLHVLGMPPAFVLSQDQTLKFIPDLLKGRPMIRASKRSLQRANIRRPHGRRPRIPSLCSTISNNNPPGPSDLQRGGAYRP